VGLAGGQRGESSKKTGNSGSFSEGFCGDEGGGIGGNFLRLLTMENRKKFPFEKGKRKEISRGGRGNSTENKDRTNIQGGQFYLCY